MGKKKARRTSEVARAQNGDLKHADDTELTAAALAATNELLATAKELYRSLGGEFPDGGSAGEHEAEDDEEVERVDGAGEAAKDIANYWWTSEEREKIRDFWLALAEEERRHLVRIEKYTVLRKMKHEQKHSCSCAVCGRKRTAIEDELQVLYDAYYEDLEQYALYQQQYLSSNRTLPPPPGPGPFPGSVEVDRYGAVVAGYPPHKLSPAALNNPNNPGLNGGVGGGGGEEEARQGTEKAAALTTTTSTSAFATPDAAQRPAERRVG
ncbi:Stress response protein NST1 [Mycena sanguinolenta]|uniref:Stress response protein NST1 n=1 Tax=Mycena sanguinolenta TaxID=230812 RepID=A0A8H7DGT7_9AGAR|nr:Stress response protein NST1 [Mycena sanguinolenta]